MVHHDSRAGGQTKEPGHTCSSWAFILGGDGFQKQLGPSLTNQQATCSWCQNSKCNRISFGRSHINLPPITSLATLFKFQRKFV